MAAHTRAAARAWRLLDAIFQQPAMRERLRWDGPSAFAITQVDMTRDMTELTVKWRAMDFAAQDMGRRLDANAARIRRTLAKAAGFKRVPRLKFVLDLRAEEQFIETEKLGIDYLLDIWKASEKGSHPSETPSLVERFDDFIQRKLQIYSKVKQYHPARAPPPAKKSDIGSVVAKALRVVFKVSDEDSRKVGELDLWEKLRDEIRKDEEVEGVFWELCELVAERDLTGESLELVFKEVHAGNSQFEAEAEDEDEDEAEISDAPPTPTWNLFEWESLDTPAESEERGPALSLDDRTPIDSDSPSPIHAFSDRVEYAIFRITEILNEPHGTNSNSEQESGPDAITEEQVERINQIIESLSEKERERISEMMEPMENESPTPQ